MAKEVFNWRMSAEQHKSSVYALRDEIINHCTDQTPLALSLILDLLPLVTEERDLIVARGNVEFNGNEFSNTGEETWIEFADQVLGNYYATIPEEWKGNVVIKDELITIEFTTPILVEIPELANLGVDRSSFQKFIGLKSTKQTTISFLVDNSDENKETWIDAVLQSNLPRTLHTPDYELASFETFDTSNNNCGADPNDPNWYVYKRTTDGLCFVHHGNIINQAQIYEYRYGPSTMADCDNYASQHCEH